MSTSSIRLPSLYRNEMTVSTQCCVLSRSVKTKRDTYDLVLRLCHLQSQLHRPNSFFGNSSRRWIALFSLRRHVIDVMNCQARCCHFAKAIATPSTTAQIHVGSRLYKKRKTRRCANCDSFDTTALDAWGPGFLVWYGYQALRIASGSVFVWSCMVLPDFSFLFFFWEYLMHLQ